MKYNSMCIILNCVCVCVCVCVSLGLWLDNLNGKMLPSRMW